MIKRLSIILLILVVVALSGCTGSDSSEAATMEIIKFDRANPNLNANIVDVKFDRDDIIAGEKVTAELSIANTGSEKITNETVEIRAKVKSLDDSLANLYLKTMSEEKKSRLIDPIEFDTEIEPGNVKPISAVFNTIKEMEGRSLAGKYEINITLSVNGQKVEARIIKITLKSGTPREFTTTPTPSPAPTLTPTSTPTPEITETATPEPTPEPTPYTAPAPTGNNTTIFVKDDRYYPSNITINAGDMVLFVNKMLEDYTLVEKDKKIPDMVLRARNNYTFFTTGEYRIELRFRNMHFEPHVLTIKVK
jgi:plastocyanin